MSNRIRALVIVGALALFAAACGDSDDPSEDAGPSGDDAGDATGGEEATGSPLEIGFINQERGSLTYGDWGAGVRAAVRYINEDLGGVDGRPIELNECITDGTADSSSTCATQLVGADVPFVINGVDLGNPPVHPILDEAGVPLIGVVPFTPDDFASQTAVWTGAMVDYFAAMPAIAAEILDGSSAVFVATDPSVVATSALAIDFQEQVAADVGLDLDTVFFNPADTGTVAAAAAQAVAADPDVIYLLQSDDVATPLVEAILAAGWTKPLIAGNALRFGSDLGQQAEGVYAISQLFQTTDGTPDEARADVETYRTAMADYEPDVDAASSFPQGGFVSVMAVHSVLEEIGADDITGDALIDAFAEDVDRHLFMGTTFNCVQNSIPAAPGICGQGVQTIQWDGEAWDNVGDPVSIVDVLRG